MAPLPDWKHLFQSFFKKKYCDNDLASPWKKKGDVAGWLSRSAWSLVLILKWREKAFNKSNCIIWIPDFFCNATLMPLRVSNATLIFYPITEKMVPDNYKCKELAKISPPDIFLLIHYFGKPFKSRAIYDFCKSHKTWLVEDAAHVLKPSKTIGELGDFVMYSPHKHLPLPDGALLLVCESGPSNFGKKIISITGLPKSWISQLKDIEIKTFNYLKSAEKESIIWLIKRILQKFSIKKFHKSKLEFSESIHTDSSPNNIIKPKQSKISRKLLPVFIKELNSVEIKRRENQLNLDKLLFSDHRLSLADRSLSGDWSPYLSAYNIAFKDPNNVCSFIEEKLGLPVLTWPDLPPEVINDNNSHLNAWTLRHKRIYIPIHQSIQYSDIVKKLKKLT